MLRAYQSIPVPPCTPNIIAVTLRDITTLTFQVVVFIDTATMRSSAFITAAGLSLITGAVANKDAITLNTQGNSWIKEAVATLVLPELPESVTGDVALWSAIMMDDYNGDFLQGVTSSSPAYVEAVNLTPAIITSS